MSILDKCNYVTDDYWYRLNGQIIWYDRRVKSWTTYRVDEIGNQISPAEYYPNKKAVIAAEKAGTFRINVEDTS